MIIENPLNYYNLRTFLFAFLLIQYASFVFYEPNYLTIEMFELNELKWFIRFAMKRI